MKTMKANYAAAGAQIRLRWVRGAFVAEGARSVRSSSVIAAEAHADGIFLELLAKYTAEGRHVSATPSANYAPAVFGKDRRADGVIKRGFATAMNRLFEAGRIKVEAFGPPSRPLKRIAITTADASE
jgi:hypothetical protein